MMGEKLPAQGSGDEMARAVTERSDSAELVRGTRTQPRVAGSASAELEPGTMVGDYQVVGKIAEGGMGTVYAGVHPIIHKRVAIKVIRRELGGLPEASERFVQEAVAVNQIGHPNIVDIFATGQLDDGRQYLVMERLEGRTLANRLDAGRMPHDEAIETLVQICAALEAAHGHDVIHRDLKPDNVFLAEEGDHIRVVLLDFGIAKLLTGPVLESNLTTPGTMVGTPEYMSPEQARGEPVDWRTDIYSLGAIAYEVFLEGAPFNGPSPMDTIAAMLANPPDTPSVVWPDIPERLEKLLLAMLSKRRELRPTLEQVVFELGLVRAELADRRNGGGVGLAGLVRDRSDSFRASRVGMTSGPVPRLTSTAMSTGVNTAAETSRWKTVALIVGLASVAAALLIVYLVRASDERAVAAATVPQVESPVVAASEAGSAIDVPAEVEPPPPARGSISFAINAEEPQVTIDGEHVDISAGEIELLAGEHTLEVNAEGYVGRTQTVFVGDGTFEIVAIELALANQSHTLSKSERQRAKSDKRRKKAKKTEKKGNDAPRFDTEGTIDPFRK